MQDYKIVTTLHQNRTLTKKNTDLFLETSEDNGAMKILKAPKTDIQSSTTEK